MCMCHSHLRHVARVRGHAHAGQGLLRLALQLLTFHNVNDTGVCLALAYTCVSRSPSCLLNRQPPVTHF